MATPNIRLKGCPRCAGDLLIDRSERVPVSYACLQCGREFPIGMFVVPPVRATPAMAFAALPAA